MSKTIKVADLFCGAGGTSAGLYDAADELGLSVDLLAVNHWHIAIKTHSYNHRTATHLCESLDNVNPRKAVPGGRLNLMMASPECTHHSNARGGKPRSEQSRASAWHVLRWAEALRVDNIMVENVKEFENWGPLGADGKPLKSKKGQTFKAWINALASLGYRVEYRVLNSADYGAATARKRLYVMAKRGNRRITWPNPTHGPEAQKPYRAAREIIDWDYPSQSIFERKKPLSPNTMKRIEAGLKKFCGEPFLAMLYGTGKARSVERPCPTPTAQGGHIGLCEPFLVNMKGQSKAMNIDKPMPTQCAQNHLYLCEPFILHQMTPGGTHSVGQPVPTITTKCGHGLVQAFIVPQFGEREGQAPRTHSVDDPLPTVTSHGAGALVQPFITKYYRTGGAVSVDEPLDTATTKPRFGLCEPSVDGYKIDIRFRMLQPHELAAAMGMQDFTFFGNKGQITKQIGNAVETKQAKALCKAILAA